MVDIICITLFGFINVIHFKRRLYYDKLRATHIKWKPTLFHFGFISLHTFQLAI